MRLKVEIKDTAKEVKEQRKILPYSITPIGGKEELKAWKAEQQRKQDEWDAKAPERHAKNFDRAWAVLNGAEPTKDKNKEIYNQYIDRQKRLQYKDASIYENSKRVYYPPKQTLLEKALDFFLNIKFE